jgi:hypothetical protein
MSNEQNTKMKHFDIVDDTHNGLNRVGNSMFIFWLERYDALRGDDIQTFIKLDEQELKEFRLWEMHKEEGKMIAHHRMIDFIHFKKLS